MFPKNQSYHRNTILLQMNDILFDSMRDTFKGSLMNIFKGCSITKYNNVFRLKYSKLELIIGRFQIVNYQNGKYLYLFDTSNHSIGNLEIKSGEWVL